MEIDYQVFRLLEGLTYIGVAGLFASLCIEVLDKKCSQYSHKSLSITHVLDDT